MLRSASRSAAQQGGPPAEPQPPERQKEALKVMGKPRATNHSGKRGAGCAHSTKDLEQDEEPSSAQQRAAKKKVRTSSKRYKGVKRSRSEALRELTTLNEIAYLFTGVPKGCPRSFRRFAPLRGPARPGARPGRSRGWYGTQTENP